MMKKTHRRIIRIFAFSGIFILLVCTVAIIYFYTHKKEFIRKAGIELNHKIQAKVIIRDAGISWLATFPYLSINLKDVSIIDTTQRIPSTPFLVAKKFYISCNLFQLIRGNIKINRIELSNGTVNFHRDSLGNSNLHILDIPEKPDHKEKFDHTLFNFMTLNNIKVFISDSSEHKNYDLLIKHIKCTAVVGDTGSAYLIDMNMHVNYLGLYTPDGTYGRNKDLNGNFKFYLNTKNKTLTLPAITLSLNHEPVIVDGIFHLDTAQHFKLQLRAPVFSYENAATTMLEKTQPFLSLFKVKRPMGFVIDLYGNTKYRSLPHVNVAWIIKDNEFSTPMGIFSKCSFSGIFINEVKKGLPRKDENSGVTINNFNGLWNEKSAINAPKIIITNLIHPYAHLELLGSCNLNDIDSLINSDDFTLEKGSANINIVYNGPINDSAQTVPDISGTIDLHNAEVLYSPRNMRLKNCNGILNFNHTAIDILNLRGNLGKSSVNINGGVESFAPVFTHNAEAMVFHCRIQSSGIDLNELIPLIPKAKHAHHSQKSQRKMLAGISSAMDEFTDLCSVHAVFTVKKISYKKFFGENLNADFTVDNANGWKINHISLNQGAGNITLDGAMIQGENDNHLIELNATMTKIDIPGIFYSFNNFGMQSFNSTNIKGQVNMKARLNLALNDQAFIIPNTLKGNLQFQLRNGGLLDFKPLEEIGQKIFPNRNFSDIEFAELSGRFSVSNNIINMSRMEIASSVLRIYAHGNYDLNGKSTDIVVQVPLNNIGRRHNQTKPDSVDIQSKPGASIFVHAVQNDHKGIDFKYNFSDKTKKLPKKP